jgi:2-amino-4-hydroxy-6-hydroxymethyldihydropteridine diphosphokinase
VTQVLISLGSNMDKERNLPAAVALLGQHPAVEVLHVSPTLETPAIGADGGVAEQPTFHNAAVLAETMLGPAELREVLRSIESQLGRVRVADKFAPRPIDLDLAFYGAVAFEGPGTQSPGLPDPDVLRFVHLAVPLAAVATLWIHPQTGETLEEIAARLTATSQPFLWAPCQSLTEVSIPTSS